MLIEMKGIVMDFGPVRAVDHVDLTVKPGEILGLLGENGAGKSTLMNVLAGVCQPVEGEIFINGKKVRIENSKNAMRLGIRFIHQELNLCDDLTVVDNLFLADEISKKTGLLNEKEMTRRAIDVLNRVNVQADPKSIIRKLQPAEKQLVEIAKALLFKSELIIMDEPSTALSTREIENLFDIMRQLKKEGVSFIYISHKMPELFEVCEKYSVLRDGKLVATGSFKEINESSVTELMIGRQLVFDSFDNKQSFKTEDIALSVKNLSGEGFRDISFDLHHGEIIAITGLQGSGRESFADALFGVIPSTGNIRLNNKPVKNASSIARRMKAGMAMVPRARKERGILNDLSIFDNLSIAYINTWFKGLFLKSKEERQRFFRQQKALSIKTDNPKNLITSLSGGNQQKVILGRWLEANAKLIIFDNPTQGIDVGTKFEIYHLILNLAKEKKAIIVFSSEFPEIHKVADSCIVLYKGEINAVLKRNEITEKNIMYYSTGANLEGGKYA